MSQAQSSVHVPVMCAEVMEFMAPRPDGVYVDMTVGAGGHASLLAEKLGAKGYLVGIDRDAAILSFARERLAPFSPRFGLHCARFSGISAVLQQSNLTHIAGVLFDLGVSSYQLSESRRGFSLLHEGPLDMRMGTDSELTAETILATFSEERLANLFWEYGEEPKAKRIAKAIVQHRKHQPLKSTLALARLVAEVSGYSNGKIHPATRIFQALRIVVNEELEELQQGLTAVIPYLEPEARVVVISFHSLEDRIVKNFFREHATELETMTEKVVTPTRAEEKSNPRSRSAKLRCARRRT